jgi:hypothetical protein
MRTAILALAVAAAACGGKKQSDTDESPPPPTPPPAAAPPANTTVNDFFARGTPTFIAGTAGDDRADDAIAAQIDLVRSQVFPKADVVADTAVTGDWPANPVVYGGAHVNQLIARLDLPLSITAGTLTIAGQTFAGDYAVAAVIPAAGGHPDFLLVAGTGTPGVLGINANLPGGAPIVVLDPFGPLVTGTWAAADLPQLADQRARRLPWRSEPRPLPGGATADIRFLKDHPRDDEAALADAAARGLARAIERLAVAEPAPVTVYVHPDAGSKKALTGNPGSGHAVVAMRALHVVANPGLDQLLAHEGTHVFESDRGPVGRTPLLSEGLAVWASGRYQGKPLADWQRALRGKVNARVVDLLGPTFRTLRESASYPIAGLLVGMLIDRVGLETYRAQLHPATAATWAAACQRAGLSPDQVDREFAALFAR